MGHRSPPDTATKKGGLPGTSRNGPRPSTLSETFMSILIETITGSRAFGFVARAVLTSMFWLSGIAKLADFNGGVAEMAHFGLEPAQFFNIVTAATQIVGSALIIANRWTWLGAAMLAVFTALTIPIAHAFWTMEEPMRTIEFHVVMEHITLIGALMVVAWKSAATDVPQPGAAEPHNPSVVAAR
jgi:transmembrane protein